MSSHARSQGGPFDPLLNQALSESFGASMSGLSLQHDTIGNAAIGAAASTTGNAISLGAGISQNLQDPFSMEVIGHEVAHALAGGGSGETAIDQPGDPGEALADNAGRSFSQYVLSGMQGTAPSLKPAVGGRAKTHRYSLEGPWDKGDPVHENLTMLTMRNALEGIEPGQEGNLLGGINRDTLPDLDSTTQHNYDPVDTPDDLQEFVRGTIWADDPKGYLFDDATGTEDYSSGLMWWEEFDADEADEPEELIARSHFGDLQFFHAMASEDGETPEETKAKMMMWAQFNVMVGTGAIDPTSSLADCGIEGMSEFFGEGQANFTVADLFGGGEGNGAELSAEIVQQRATGALLHMIQDSHATGHAERNEAGEIVEFHSYGSQDHGDHAHFDEMGGGANLQEHIQNTPGAMDAILRGGNIVRMMDQGASLEDIMANLDTEVFALAANARPAGPGDLSHGGTTPPPPVDPALQRRTECLAGCHGAGPGPDPFAGFDDGRFPSLFPEVPAPATSPSQDEVLRQWLEQGQP